MTNTAKPSAADSKKQGEESNAAVDNLIAEAGLSNGSPKSAKVPPQSEGEKSSGDAKSDESPDLTVIDGGKKSIKERATELSAKIKANKKALTATIAVVGAATVIVIKYATKKAQLTLVETVNEDDQQENVEEVAAGDTA